MIARIAKIIGTPLWKPNVSDEERLNDVKCHMALVEGVLGFIDPDTLPDLVRETIYASRAGFGEITEFERNTVDKLTDVLFDVIADSKYSPEVVVETCKYIIIKFITDYETDIDIEELISDFRKCNAFCMIMDDNRDNEE